MIARGEIRWLRWSQTKRRPALVLGRAEVVPSLSQVPVMPFSTTVRGLPWEVSFSAGDGMPVPCVLKPEWIRAVDRSAFGPLITVIDPARWTEVRGALLAVLGL